MAQSNAERQKAWRERQKQEKEGQRMADALGHVAQREEQGTPKPSVAGSTPAVPLTEELVAAAAELGVDLTKTAPVPSSLMTLSDYVAQASLGAELFHAQTSPNANLNTQSLGERIENAERYARWRYAGMLEGTVNGL